jgi:hypothetical protein
MGRATLAAAALLWIAWFFTPALTLREDISNVSKSFTFWDLVGLDPNTNIVTTPASHGLFGLLGLLAIAAPFASPFIRNPKAKYLVRDAAWLLGDRRLCNPVGLQHILRAHPRCEPG